MEESNPLKAWLRPIGIGFGLFLAGGVISFAYSYRPLHGAMVHKAAALEIRLDERNRENLKLSDEIARLRADDSERIAPETLSAIRKELAETKRTLAQTDKDLKRIERKYKDARTGSARWQKRYEKLRDETQLAKAAPPTPSPSAGNPAQQPTPSQSEQVKTESALPAAPAPSPTPGPTQPQGSQTEEDRGTLQPSPAQPVAPAP